MSWRFLPNGVVELTLQEAYAADWTDPLAGDYQVVGINVGPSPGSYLPYPPTALATTAVAGGIDFVITLPNQVLPGTMIEVWEYTANTPFSSATLVWFGTVTKFVLYKTDVVTRYYWARTRGPNNQTSATFPVGNGVAGAALSPVDSVWLPWVVGAGSAIVADEAAMKNGGVNAWDSSIYTVKGYQNCHITAKVNATAGNDIMVGFTDVPTLNPSPIYSRMNAAWYMNSSIPRWEIWEGGALVLVVGAASTSDRVYMTYDFANVRYYLNGTLSRTVFLSGAVFYGMVVFSNPGAGVNSLLYGPTTNFQVNDTDQINFNATSQLISASIAGTTTVSYPISGAVVDSDIIAAVITSNGYPVGIDASCDFTIVSSNNNAVSSCLVTIQRGGVNIGTAIFDAYDAYSTAFSQSWKGQVTLSVTDTPPAAGTSYTYAFHARGTATGTLGNPQIKFANATLKAREYKR